LKSLFTLFTAIGSFPIGIFERVAEIHDTTRIRAMRQAERMADLVNRLFNGALAKGFFISVNPQPE
jgi:hypothetical protein